MYDHKDRTPDNERFKFPTNLDPRQARFTLSWMSHMYATDSHANAMLFDSRHKVLIRFEPHGSKHTVCDGKLDPALRNYAEELGKKLDEKWSYLSPQDLFSSSSHKAVQGRDKMCVMWALLFAHYVLDAGASNPQSSETPLKVCVRILRTHMNSSRGLELENRGKRYAGYIVKHLVEEKMSAVRQGVGVKYDNVGLRNLIRGLIADSRVQRSAATAAGPSQQKSTPEPPRTALAAAPLTASAPPPAATVAAPAVTAAPPAAMAAPPPPLPTAAPVAKRPAPDAPREPEPPAQRFAAASLPRESDALDADRLEALEHEALQLTQAAEAARQRVNAARQAKIAKLEAEIQTCKGLLARTLAQQLVEKTALADKHRSEVEELESHHAPQAQQLQLEHDNKTRELEVLRRSRASGAQ